MIVILMGVSGSGKTTVGRHLAEKLKWQLLDADDFHPPANIEKMTAKFIDPAIVLDESEKWQKLFEEIFTRQGR